MKKMIAIFCGSSDLIDDQYLQAAAAIGTAVAQRGWGVVYGAGSTGMMGAVARAALAAGGEVVGVIPEIFDTPTLALRELTRYEVTPDMHTRKARMAELSDAFIALPGGYGTLEEFFEALTWNQIGVHSKPMGLLNTKGYYDPLVTFLVDKVQGEGFAYKEHAQLFSVEAEPDALLDQLAAYQPPDGLARWVDR